MSDLEEDEDVVVKGGALHEHLINSGFTDFEIYDKSCWSLESTKPKDNFFQPVLKSLPDQTELVHKYFPSLFEDPTCYDLFLNYLLNSPVVRPEAEYWLRNFRKSFKAKKITPLSSDEALNFWQSPFSWIIEKPALLFFLAQGGLFACKQFLLQERLLTLKQLLAILESFNRKLGLAMHLIQQEQMSHRFLSSTLNHVAESLLSNSGTSGVLKLVVLLKGSSTLLKAAVEEMNTANQLPAEYDCRHTLGSFGNPDLDLANLSHRNLKDIHLYYKEVLTVFTHQLALNFVLHAKREGPCKVENVFPVLGHLTQRMADAKQELKEIVDVLKGVRLLRMPPKAKDGDPKRHNYYVNPLVPAIESSRMHLKNALTLVLHSSNLSDSGFEHALQTLQASRMELAASDSFLHKAEILVARLNKTKEVMSSMQDESLEVTNGKDCPPITIDLSSTLGEVGDPFLEEVFQGVSVSGGSLEWDDGHEDDSVDSANNTYYRHLMSELHSVLLSRGRSRATMTPQASFVQVATSTPFIAPRTNLNTTIQLEDSLNGTVELDNSSNRTIQLDISKQAQQNEILDQTVDLGSSLEDLVIPTPAPRKVERLTYVSPSTLSDHSASNSLASMVAERARQMAPIEETFEDETVFEDAHDKTIMIE
ncbi:uncharacterized protein LOC132193132 isoform X2 [Neocloeon triangulifer]|uniref:uncharacterized protein LOC132193132 isoform X2 n=1 Tax=Neocloeon triangulifer TaxID=2078957 RepID=UPI00286FA911|nr:uncharacterized protein LOC132193132 isoform X2 [Neocloeon triangulifer]